MFNLLGSSPGTENECSYVNGTCNTNSYYILHFKYKKHLEGN